MRATLGDATNVRPTSYATAKPKRVSTLFVGVRPGEQNTISLPLARLIDMTRAGKYTIVFGFKSLDFGPAAHPSTQPVERFSESKELYISVVD